MFTKLLSILLAFSVVGGAVYLVRETEKRPARNEGQTENTEIMPTTGTAARGHRGVGRPVIDQPVSASSPPASDGSLVKCVERGKVTYSNAGCKDGMHSKPVEMNHAAGIVSPSRELIDSTVNRMFAERAAENRRLEETARRQNQVSLINYQGRARTDQCNWLHARNNAIDRESNQALTGFQQDRLRAEKYENTKRQFELRC
jgi:hypothetical protein